MNTRWLSALVAAAVAAASGTAAQNTALAPADPLPPARPSAGAPAPVLGPISDFNAVGDVSANALLGATVRNPAREAVGKVEDVYVSKNGEIKSVVLSVGGFLGMGARHVLVAWGDLQLQRENDTLLMTMKATREQLKAMPEYTFERRPLRN